MWLKMSDAEVLQRSDLIVLGTWQGPVTAPATAGAAAHRVGAVSVSEVLKGPAATTRALVVIAAVDAPRSSSELSYCMGEHGLWLLRKQPGGPADHYLADHPQRFVPSATESARIKALRELLRRR